MVLSTENDYVVWVVWCYIEDEWKEPGLNWSDYYFNRSAYSRWAGYTILDLLKNRGSESPTRIVNDFYGMMDEYSCMSKPARDIFSIAREAASEILSIVRSIE